MSKDNRKTIYVAAPLAMVALASRVAVALGCAGHVTCASWIEPVMRVGGTQESRDPEVRTRILQANLSDISKSNLLVALTHVGNPKGTRGEIAWALGMGTPVLWIQGTNGEGSDIFDAHPDVDILRVRVPQTTATPAVIDYLDDECIASVVAAVERMS